MHLHQHPDQHPDEHPEQGAWRTCSAQPLVWAYMGIVLDGLLQGLCMACSWLVEEVDDADPDAHASGC